MEKVWPASMPAAAQQPRRPGEQPSRRVDLPGRQPSDPLSGKSSATLGDLGAEIAHDRHDARTRALSELSQLEGHRKGRAVGAHELEFVVRTAGDELRGQIRDDRLPLPGGPPWKQRRGSDRLIPWDADHPLEGVIDLRNPALFVDHADAVWKRIEQNPCASRLLLHGTGLGAEKRWRSGRTGSERRATAGFGTDSSWHAESPSALLIFPHDPPSAHKSRNLNQDFGVSAAGDLGAARGLSHGLLRCLGLPPQLGDLRLGLPLGLS